MRRRPTPPRDDAAAIIPALDEAATIADVVRRTRRCVGAVIVVDDGSADETAARARASGADVIPLGHTHGYAHAVRAGLRVARSRGFSRFVTLDADGAHDPADVAALLRRNRARAEELTIGDRFRSAGAWDVPSTKRWANFFAAALVNHLVGTHLSDVACGLRVMGPRLADRVLAARLAPGFALPYQQIAIARREGLRIGSAAVRVRYDARQLHCTATREMIDLLRVCRANARRARDRRLLDEMLSAVTRERPMVVRAGGRVICLHPIPERAAYIFQLQHPFFDTRDVAVLGSEADE